MWEELNYGHSSQIL